ncbi:glycoside hydrolase superfamily [Coniella lustricola]|uniref:Glycoside hydrolase superfamily n=1 Tax=Coniella lustricola TaxID=2025994 RepID=A0A2T3A994_9PEZI|nr:glycoside hydrolase superfamily [Coniella lustricola]
MLIHYSRTLVALFFVFSVSSTAASRSTSTTATTATPFPNGPFTTNASTILGADGSPFVYAGVNWPGAEVVMIPEGLQYQSIATIVSKIQSLGMNTIRLTYATEMIDQVYSNGLKDIPIKTAFVKALGVDEGMRVFQQVVARNPEFNEDTTRLQVYDAIAAECAKHQIYIHLDNHVSKASWCCDPFDGSTWWDDVFFCPAKWTRGLSFMAAFGMQWPNLISMSLYNELRPPFSSTKPDLMRTYNWDVWYEQIQAGSKAIHDLNPDVLIFLSGLNGDTDLEPVVDGSPLIPSNTTFQRADFAGYDNKLVLELHSYDILLPVTDCLRYQEEIMQAGYSTASDSREVANRFPMVMTEWGFKQDNTTWLENTYAICVQEFLGSRIGSGWMIWVLSGSYYSRKGNHDADESWGLLDHEWSAWRSPDYIEGGLKPLVKQTLGSTGYHTRLRIEEASKEVYMHFQGSSQQYKERLSPQ